jgi:hypothetical protein
MLRFDDGALVHHLDRWIDDAGTLCQLACQACVIGRQDLFDSLKAELDPILPKGVLPQLTAIIAGRGLHDLVWEAVPRPFREARA